MMRFDPPLKAEDYVMLGLTMIGLILILAISTPLVIMLWKVALTR